MAVFALIATPVSADDLEALADALSAHAGEALVFNEYRQSELLTEPLQLRGRLLFTPPDRFEKIIETPYFESQLITQGRVWIEREGQRTRSFSLKRAPELAVLTSALGKLLSGDAAGLEAHFQARLEHMEQDGTEQGWQLELVPKDGALAEHIAHIRLQGHDGTLTQIETTLPDGQTLLTEIE